MSSVGLFEEGFNPFRTFSRERTDAHLDEIVLEASLVSSTWSIALPSHCP